MKVIVNGRFLWQRATGVQNYANGILKSLIKSGAVIEVVMPPFKDNRWEFSVKPIGYSNGFIWEQFFLPMYIRKQTDALLLNLCNTAPLALKAKAVTIHDLAFEQELGNWFNKRFKQWYRFMIPRVCSSSKVIFTVSAFSKKELIKHYNIPAEKIVVAPPGLPDMTFDSSSLPKCDYVVVTGANNPRKNASWVINNIDVLEKKGLTLVLVGNNAKAFNNLSFAGNKNIIYLENVPSPSYFSLIKNAKALICPSVYEGFGIPILESLCLGTPVVASNIPVFKETFGDLPLYFDLNDLTTYRKAVEGIAEKKVTTADIEMLKSKYNYEKSTQLILETIEKLAKL